jgi:hypothetical protein
MIGCPRGRVARSAVLALLVVLLPGLLYGQGTVLAQDGGSIASCLPGWSQESAPSAERILRCVREASRSAIVVGEHAADPPAEPSPCPPVAAPPAPSEAAGRSEKSAPSAAGDPPAGRSDPAGDSPPARGAAAATAATFRLCGGDGPETARAIERFVDGRSFSARASSRADGCVDLALSLGPPSGAASSQSATLSVGTGRGRVTVRLVSQDGQTRVSIGDQPAPGGRREDG